MNKFLFLLCVLLAPALTVRAQETSRAEVFGGYSYLNVDTNGLSARQSANGWEASVAGNFNRTFAIEGDVAGYYKTYDFDLRGLLLGPVNLRVKVSDYSFAAGPRANLGPVFVHALLGEDHLTGSTPGLSASQNSFAGAFGGGIEHRISGAFSIRAGGDYVFTRHNIVSNTGGYTQNNFRASVGIVYNFGSLGIRAPRGSQSAPRSEPSARGQIVQEAVLLGVAGYSVPAGIQVTLVRDGSLGARAGIQAGDVIFRIDGAPVRTIPDLETALGTSSSGTAHIDYLTKGMGAVSADVVVRRRQ